MSPGGPASTRGSAKAGARSERSGTSTTTSSRRIRRSSARRSVPCDDSGHDVGVTLATSVERGLVYDIQRFSVHDGPGIRTTVFFKGCPLRCRWCQSPESLRPRAEVAFFADRCRAGGECLGSCPAGALVPGAGRVLRERCDGCVRASRG